MYRIYQTYITNEYSESILDKETYESILIKDNYKSKWPFTEGMNDTNTNVDFVFNNYGYIEENK